MLLSITLLESKDGLKSCYGWLKSKSLAKASVLFVQVQRVGKQSISMLELYLSTFFKHCYFLKLCFSKNGDSLCGQIFASMLNPKVHASKNPDIYSIKMTASHVCNESRCLYIDHIKRELHHENLANSKAHHSAYQPKVVTQLTDVENIESSNSLVIQTAIQSIEESAGEEVSFLKFQC